MLLVRKVPFKKIITILHYSFIFIVLNRSKTFSAETAGPNIIAVNVVGSTGIGLLMTISIYVEINDNLANSVGQTDLYLAVFSVFQGHQLFSTVITFFISLHGNNRYEKDMVNIDEKMQ